MKLPPEGAPLLFRRDGVAPPGRTQTEDEQRPLDTGGRIRCPRCGWEPPRDARWACLCGHSWNTFETAGICPACLHAWDETQCLRCHEWSAHAEWYASAE